MADADVRRYDVCFGKSNDWFHVRSVYVNEGFGLSSAYQALEL